MFVVVAGLPGSGKTTLARDLARELELPLISKDTIKEALFDGLGSGDVEWSQRLGRASHLVMYALARELGTGVLESHFWRGVSEPDLMALGGRLIVVYCCVPTEVAVRRYVERASDPARHPGHLPEHQGEDVIRPWREAGLQRLELDAPVIDVDTRGPVDVGALAKSVRAVWPA